MNQLITQAFQLHQSGNLTESEYLYRQALKSEPEAMNTWQLLGLNLHEQGRHQEAVVALEKAIALAPSTGVLYNSLGVVQLALKDFSLAASCFQKAISLDSNCTEAQRNLCTVAEQCDDETWAVELFGKVLDQDPCNGRALFGFSVRSEQFNQIHRTVEYCVKALKTNWDFAPAHLLLGMILSSRLTPDRRAKLELKERTELTEKALGTARHLITGF